MNISEYAQPSISIETVSAEKEQLRTILTVGGLPALPPSVAWPRCSNGHPIHFLFQLDLAALPRQTTHASCVYDMPDFPETGTVFVFMNLYGDSIWMGDAPIKALYTAEDVSKQKHCQPPNDLIALDENCDMVNLENVAPDRRVLKPISGRVKGSYLSHLQGNPFIPNEHGHLLFEDLKALDQKYGSALQEIGLDYPVRKPRAAGLDDPFYARSALELQYGLERSHFSWTWYDVYELAQAALVRFRLECNKSVAYRFDDDTEMPVNLKKLRGQIEGNLEAVKQIESRQISDRVTINQRLRASLYPSLRLPYDAQFEAWMSYAQVSGNKDMSDPDKHAFNALFEQLEDRKRDQEPARLTFLKGIGGHDMIMFDVRRQSAQAIQDLGKTRSEEFVPDPLIEEMSRCDLLVFGYGHSAYDARIDHTRHVRLFEFGELGERLASLDNIVQVWIDMADLAEGNFENLLTVVS